MPRSKPSHVVYMSSSDIPATRAERQRLEQQLQTILFKVIQALPTDNRERRTESLGWMRDVINDARAYLAIGAREGSS